MKYKMTITFELDDDDFTNDPQERYEFEDFVKDALESWGGQRHPDDWLFDSLENVVVADIKRIRGPGRSRPGKKG